MTLSSIPITINNLNTSSDRYGSEYNSDYYIRQAIFNSATKGSYITSFYKELRRNLLTLFSSFSVQDNEGKLRTIKCVPGSPERAVGHKIRQNTRILPILGIEQFDTKDEPDQRRHYPMITTETMWDDTKQRAIRVVSLVPKSVSIEYEVSIWAYYKEDLDQLTEQIQRAFNPSIDLNISFTKYGKIFLEREINESSKELGDGEDRVLIKTFRLKVETHIPYPKFLLTSTGQIQEIILDTFTFEEARDATNPVDEEEVTILSPSYMLANNWAPDNEFEIPSNTGASGKRWTRVTRTNYNASGGWAFAYNFGTRVKARFFTNSLSGTAPNRALIPITSDLTPDPSLTSVSTLTTTALYTVTHDEPDICWHPTTSAVMMGWNVRLPTSAVSPYTGRIMDQYFRVYNQSGVALSGSDGIATQKILESQWRPIIEPLEASTFSGAFLYSFTGNDKDSAFFNVLSSVSPWAFITSSDIQMPSTIGVHRQVDQHAIELPDGRIFAVWHHVEGPAKIRYRLFDPSFVPVTASHQELPLQLSYGISATGKSEPRALYVNGKIWIVYHHQIDGGEYEGIDVYAAILDYTSSSATLTLNTPEFSIHDSRLVLPGLQRKPEMVTYHNRVLVVFEHYPSGYVSPTNIPQYIGGSNILGRLYDYAGNPLTDLFQINGSTSTNNGVLNFMLRPSLDVSLDAQRILVCWTSSANNNIYATGSNSKIWAKILQTNYLP